MTYSQLSLVKKVTVNYYAYLKSKAWKKKRLSRLKKDDFKCQFIESGKYCHCKTSLEVHHLTYERLGKERITDLITLCHEHHQKTHLTTTGNQNENKTTNRSPRRFREHL